MLETLHEHDAYDEAYHPCLDGLDGCQLPLPDAY
jgi:hypothetical protein